MQHPNAFAAAASTAISALVLYVAHRIGYAHLTSEQAIAVAGAVITAVLFVGRRGLRYVVVGVWVGFWRGTEKPSAPPKT